MNSAHLTISVLGKLQIHLNGEPLVDFASIKAQALLVYLALQPQAASRSLLASLLWGDMTEESARANLRLVLNKLNKPFAPFLDVSRNEIGLEKSASIWVDARTFTTEIANAETIDLPSLQTVLDLYRGEFLYDFPIRDAPEFELWAVETREQLQAIAFRGLLIAARRYGESAEYTAGIRAARQAVTLDSFNEEAHRLLMLLLAQDGERSAALQQYETCLYVLSEELGVDPAPETTQLYEQIRNGKVGLQRQLYSPRSDTATLKLEQPNLLRIIPRPPTRFIGRDPEIAHILALLDQPDCRLITLSGLGGIGKTHLAIACAEQYALKHTDRSVVFVSLTWLNDALNTPQEELIEMLASSIAEAFRLVIPVTENFQEGVLDFLSHQNMLLILDNFEEFQRAAGWISRLLEKAPRLTLLVTSRVRMAVNGEWVIQLDGLPLAESVQLYREAAKRIQVTSSDIGYDEAAIQRICELVEGSPLAIEMASQWIHTIPATTIAQRLEDSIDLLQTSANNVPGRHQSIRAVFDYTWRSLGETSQDVFARLSVFRGTLDLEAAEQIAGASLPILNRLCDQSLVRHEAGRYRLHELLRRFSVEKLHEAQSAAEVHRRMAAFYLNFLKDRAHIFTHEFAHEAEQQLILNQIDREIENIRTVLEWQIAHSSTDDLMHFLGLVWHYLQRKGWYNEAVMWLIRALERSHPESKLDNYQHAWLLQRIGIANYEMGHTARSLSYFQQTLGLLGYHLPNNERGWERESLIQIWQQFRHRTQFKKALKPNIQGDSRQQYADEVATGFYYLARIYFLSNDLLPYLVSTIRCVNIAENAQSTTNLSGYYGALALLIGGIGLHRIASIYTRLAQHTLSANLTWRSQASAFEEFGLYAFLRGRWSHAQTLLMDAARFYERANLTRYAGEDLALAANACFHLAKVTESRQIVSQFVQLAGSLSDPRALIWEPMMTCQGALRLGTHPISEIIQNLTSFEAMYHTYLSTQDTLRLQAMLAMANFRAGQYQLAEQYTSSGLELASQDHNLTMYLTEGLGTLTEVCISLWEGNPQREYLGALAKKGCRQLQKFVKNFPGACVQLRLCQGGIAWLTGQKRQAIHHWQVGLQDAEKLQMPYEQARLHLELGRHMYDPMKADESLKHASDLCVAYGFAYELSWVRSLRTQNKVSLRDWVRSISVKQE